jgi:hypothetical protein
MTEKSSNNSISFYKRIPLISVIGTVVGIIGGYIYYKEVGCVSGTCAITSNPYMSMIWGGALGYLLFDMFRKKKETKPDDTKV